MCSSALTPSSVRSALPGPRDLQGQPDTAYHKSASHCLKHGLAQAVSSSCLYSDPSFICTVCTAHGVFLCALCVASEGPLWPVEHCFVLISSHDKKDYGCVQMLRTPSVCPRTLCWSGPEGNMGIIFKDNFCLKAVVRVVFREFGGWQDWQRLVKQTQTQITWDLSIYLAHSWVVRFPDSDCPLASLVHWMGKP